MFNTIGFTYMGIVIKGVQLENISSFKYPGAIIRSVWVDLGLRIWSEMIAMAKLNEIGNTIIQETFYDLLQEAEDECLCQQTSHQRGKIPVKGWDTNEYR